MKIKSNIRMDSYGAVLSSTILSVYIMGKGYCTVIKHSYGFFLLCNV